MDAQEKTELGVILGQLLVPENTTRAQAEQRFKVLSKNAKIIPGLLEYLHASPEAQVRQLAALLLRKKIMVHWLKIGPEAQEAAKALLLDKIVQEPTSIVRRAVADLVGAIAKTAVAAGQWPTLLTFLHQCTQSPQADHREVALVLFVSLTESAAEVMHGHFDTLYHIFLQGLQDSEPKVRLQALRSVQALLDLMEGPEDMAKVSSLIRPIIAVCNASIQLGDEDILLMAFELMFEIVEAPSKIIGPYIADLTTFCLQVGQNKELDANTRQQGMEVVSQLGRAKPKQLTKAKLIPPLVQALCAMCAEESDDTADDDYQLSTHKFAAQALDTVAQFVPPQQVVPAVVEFCRSAIPSPDFNQRRAAMSALSVCAEGCAEIMRKQLDTILQPVLSLLVDPNQEVRGMAAFAVSQFATYLQPDIISHHDVILKGLFHTLQDPTPSVKERTLFAIEALCEHLGEKEVVPYMGPLMQVLMEALNQPRTELQEMALSAATSVASAAGRAFGPYMPQLLPMMQRCMQATAPEHLAVRAHATECMGILIASEGGKEALSMPHIVEFVKMALEGFNPALTGNTSQLREYTFGFFANVAEATKAEFVPFLPAVVPLALTALNQYDGAIFDDDDENDDEDENKDNSIVGGVRAALGDEDDDDESEEGKNNLSVRTGILDEKASATQAMGSFAEATGAAFAPYIETVLPVLLRMAEYFHPDVRNQAMIALHQLVEAAALAAPLNADGTPPPPLQAVLTATVPIFVKCVQRDDDADVVSSSLVACAKAIKAVGGSPLAEWLGAMTAAITDVLKGETLCQVEGDSDEEGEEEEEDGGSGSQTNTQEMLLEGVAELLPALCGVGDGQFLPALQGMMPDLLKLCSKHKTDHMRALLSAIFADCVKAIGPASIGIIQGAAPHLVRETKADDGTNRRNAAYALGICLQAAGPAPAAAALYGPFLTELARLLQDAEEEAAVKDNAAGALGRILQTRGGPLPLNETIALLLSALPLKEDFEEAENAYGGLCSLLQSKDPQVFPHAPSILKAMATALVFDVAGGEKTVAHMRATFQQLQAEYPEQLDAMLAAMQEDERTALSALRAN